MERRLSSQTGSICIMSSTAKAIRFCSLADFRTTLLIASVRSCNLRGGDLVAAGTVSGRDVGSEGCLLEKQHNAEPIRLPARKVRTYLEDGDRVTLSANAGNRDCQGSESAYAAEPFQVQSINKGNGLRSASRLHSRPTGEEMAEELKLESELHSELHSSTDFASTRAVANRKVLLPLMAAPRRKLQNAQLWFGRASLLAHFITCF
jgi:hypothetical protein